MTQQLEETIDNLDRKEALKVLDAVNGTLVALRRDAVQIGRTKEIDEVIRRIDAYLGHLDRQRTVMTRGVRA